MLLKNLTDIEILQMKWDILEALQESRKSETKTEETVDEKVRTFDEVTNEDKQKKSKKGYKKGIPVYEMKQYSRFRKRRTYDMKTKQWTCVNGDKGKSIKLSFEDLIVLISDYRDGIHPKETFKKIKSTFKTYNGVQYLQYIYRAGGFNDGIYENARRFGYAPQDLVSNECKEVN